MVSLQKVNETQQFNQSVSLSTILNNLSQRTTQSFAHTVVHETLSRHIIANRRQKSMQEMHGLTMETVDSGNGNDGRLDYKHISNN